MKALTLFAVVSIAILTGPMTALAWNPLRSENSNVKKGNTLMSKHQYSDALQAYDKAAEKLPDTPGIQLNRGLALFGEDQTDSAKEAFLQAADPSFPVPLRADAYYDLGVAFATQGDTLAEQKEHDKAIAQYREAVDAFKRSLRIQPADRNAAWNLEYAQARIVEQEQQQQDEQQQQQDEQQQQQDEQQQQQDEQQQQQDEQQQQQNEQQQQQDEQQQQQQDEQQQSQDENKQQQDEQQQQQNEQQQQPQGTEGEEEETQVTPEHIQRFLDALEQNEESLPVQRERQRATKRIPPEKDW